MTTSTYDGGPSRVELELLMRAAARAATPAEQGREQAGRVTARLVTGLGLVAGAVALLDVGLVVAA